MSSGRSASANRKDFDSWIEVPPVFIIGCARSGTTLLRLMLTAHPHISISSEGFYIFHLRSKLESYGDLSNQDNLKALYENIQFLIADEKYLNPPRFDQFLAWVERHGVNLKSIITFYGTWEANFLGKKTLSWWGDNAPYHAHHIPFFNSLFPDSRFIYMMRDPRDTCASSKTSLAGHTLDRAIRDWEKSLLHGLLAKVFLGPDRFTLIRYEDLVRNAAGQLAQICNFLNVEFSENMLRFYESPVAGAISQLDHHRNLQRPVFTDSISKYKAILNDKELAIIEERLSAQMTYFGYVSYERYEKLSQGLFLR